MATEGGETDVSLFISEDELQEKFRKERKELQAQVMKLKHSVPKGDKKKKKEVQEEIAKQEASLDAKQNEEMEKWKSLQECENERREVSDDLSSLDVSSKGIDVEDEDLEEKPQANAGKKSKAQKRREKKQTKDREREERIKEQAVINKQGPRQQELVKIATMLKARGQALHEIPADGNCMYNAVAHQLSLRKMETSNEELRQKTANYMRSHQDDFLPFLTNNNTGDMMTEEEFSDYCNKTAKSPVWGGQLELRALSEILRIPIEVLQADMQQPLLIGDTAQGHPITVVYQRHAFRLGEHYNSVVEKNFTDEEENGEEIQENGLT